MKLSYCKKSVLVSFVIENEDEKPKQHSLHSRNHCRISWVPNNYLTWLHKDSWCWVALTYTTTLQHCNQVWEPSIIDTQREYLFSFGNIYQLCPKYHIVTLWQNVEVSVIETEENQLEKNPSVFPELFQKMLSYMLHWMAWVLSYV